MPSLLQRSLIGVSRLALLITPYQITIPKLLFTYLHSPYTVNYNVKQTTPRGSTMAKNKHNGVIELWGHEFKKAGEGLDKGEVKSFVDELMKKHEALLKRTEHLSSLTKLAEKTIEEADNVAKQVRSEAEEQARTESKTIISEAEEQAQKLIEGKRAEALATVNQEVEAIKAKAQQEAENMLEERTKEIQPELRKNIKRLYGELLSQLENLKQQVVTLEEELDQKLFQTPEETSTVVEETSQVAEETSQVAEETSQVAEETSQVAEETSQVAEETSQVAEEISQAVEEISQEDRGTSQEGEEASQSDNEFLELFQPASETGEDQPEWELEILPPIDLTQILDIINSLDSLNEVKQTELIPQMDRPKITVFLSQPIELLDILRELPQVAQVTEVTGTSNGDAKPRKAKIELSRKGAYKPSN
jgi:myosin heavy subunit